MNDEEIIRIYVRSQSQVERDLTPPDWLTGDKRKWWIDEASKIKQESKKV